MFFSIALRFSISFYFSRLPITLAQLQAGNSSNKLKVGLGRY